MAGRGVLRQVYLAAAVCRTLASEARVMVVTPLLAALLRRVCERGTLTYAIPEQGRLLDVLLDELLETSLQPIELPMPTDARARLAAEQVQADPIRASRNVIALSRLAGASVRTLERLFQAETGLSFGAWRQRARLVHAMTMLADGATVTQAGFAAGYSGTSAFVAAFRRMTGVTPGRYGKSARRLE
jgi:AraC-like DNA-binding protein